MAKRIKKQKKAQFDTILFYTILILLGFGLIMVFSASSESASYYQNNAYYFVIRQFIWICLGLVAMLIVSNIDYRIISKYAFLSFVIAIALLILVLIVGMDVKGSMRQISLGFFSFQPSEVAKLAVIIFFSSSLSKNPGILNKFWKGLFVYLAILGVISVLMLLEPHFSGMLVIFIVGIIILFVAGAKIMHFVFLAIPVIGAGIYFVLSEPYRLTRVLSFMDPFKYKSDSGYQVVQSLYAIGSGGLFGLGLGNSRQKFLYIPEPHNDFIFSIICEELGFVGALFVITLFIILIWRGIMIAVNAKDTFSSLVAVGITSLIAIQALFNIAVVTSSVPATGMTLPFISYGGTSLLFLLVGVGMLLNISRSQNTAKKSLE